MPALTVRAVSRCPSIVSCQKLESQGCVLGTSHGLPSGFFSISTPIEFKNLRGQVPLFPPCCFSVGAETTVRQAAEAIRAERLSPAAAC